MSFRARFLTIIGLAIAMVVAAALTFAQLHRESAETREETARRTGEEVLGTLLRAAAVRGVGGVRALEDGRVASALADDIVLEGAGSADASAGYCASDGTLLVTRSATPAHALHAPRDWLLPADRDFAREACRNARPDGVYRARQRLPRDVLIASSRAMSEGLVAWSMMRLPPNEVTEHAPLLAKLGVLGLASLLLVVLTIDTLLTLRRGARDIEGALLRLQEDLYADVPSPTADELGRIAAGLRTMARRLAESRAHERTLERRLDHEERLSALGRVVAGVAHEVRNPLTGIKLKLDGLARRALDARSRGDIEVCLQEIARLDRIVSSLVLVARPAPAERAPVDLGALADQRLAQAMALAEERAIRLEREGTARALGSRDALARVLDNLVRNAIEASARGDVVRVRIAAGEGDARVEVLDRGAGIPRDRLGELFEPFFTLKGDGTGLGLFLSRALAHAQGGRITYERRDEATLFTLSLPASPLSPASAVHG